MTEKEIGALVAHSDDCLSFGDGVTLVLDDAFDSGGALQRFSLNLAKHNIVFLQIWRPEGGAEYSLVYQQEVDTENLPGLGRQEVKVTEDDVQVQAGDRLGLSVQEGNIGIAHGSGGDKGVYGARDFIGPRVHPGRKFTFEPRELPARFCIVATYVE